MQCTEYLMICSQAGYTDGINKCLNTGYSFEQIEKALMIANAMNQMNTVQILRKNLAQKRIEIWVDHVIKFCALIRLQRRFKKWYYDPDHGPFLKIALDRNTTFLRPDESAVSQLLNRFFGFEIGFESV